MYSNRLAWCGNGLWQTAEPFNMMVTYNGYHSLVKYLYHRKLLISHMWVFCDNLYDHRSNASIFGWITGASCAAERMKTPMECTVGTQMYNPLNSHNPPRLQYTDENLSWLVNDLADMKSCNPGHDIEIATSMVTSRAPYTNIDWLRLWHR